MHSDNGRAAANNQMPKIEEKTVPEITDLLRYLAMLWQNFGGRWINGQMSIFHPYYPAETKSD